MKKPSTTKVRWIGKLQDRQLTIGLDLGDRSSFYCVLNGSGEVILEERVTTSAVAMTKTECGGNLALRGLRIGRARCGTASCRCPSETARTILANPVLPIGKFRSDGHARRDAAEPLCAANRHAFAMGKPPSIRAWA